MHAGIPGDGNGNPPDGKETTSQLDASLHLLLPLPVQPPAFFPVSNPVLFLQPLASASWGTSLVLLHSGFVHNFFSIAITPFTD